MMKTRWFLAIISIMGLSLSGGCDRGSSAPAESNQASGANEKPAGAVERVFVDSAPTGARDIAEVKKDASATGDVVVRGRVGGRAQPFVNGAAVFVLTDASLKSCDQHHGENCKTPWDYCCEPRESLAANMLTVQIVGDDGRPLRETVRGRHGLEPLKEIVVAGKIAERNEGGGLVINATKIAVVN